MAQQTAGATGDEQNKSNPTGIDRPSVELEIGRRNENKLRYTGDIADADEADRLESHIRSYDRMKNPMAPADEIIVSSPPKGKLTQFTAIAYTDEHKPVCGLHIREKNGEFGWHISAMSYGFRQGKDTIRERNSFLYDLVVEFYD